MFIHVVQLLLLLQLFAAQSIISAPFCPQDRCLNHRSKCTLSICVRMGSTHSILCVYQGVCAHVCVFYCAVRCCNPNESCTYLFFIVGNCANAMTTFCTADRESSPSPSPLPLPLPLALCPAYFSMCVQLFKCAVTATKNKTELWHVFVVVLIQQCPVGAEARGKRGGFVFGSLVASLASLLLLLLLPQSVCQLQLLSTVCVLHEALSLISLISRYAFALLLLPPAQQK